MPIGEFNDLVSCWAITNGAKEREDGDDEEMIPDIP